jgi:hypothetical protein
MDRSNRQPRRRWFQLSLRSLFLLTLLVAAYFAGYRTAVRQAENAQAAEREARLQAEREAAARKAEQEANFRFYLGIFRLTGKARPTTMEMIRIENRLLAMGLPAEGDAFLAAVANAIGTRRMRASKSPERVEPNSR